THGKQALGSSLLAITVADTPMVPIGKLYVELFTARGFTIIPISVSEFCQGRDEVIRKMSAACQPFLLAYPLPVCGLEKAHRDVKRVIVVRYAAPCSAKPAPSAMLLEPG